MKTEFKIQCIVPLFFTLLSIAVRVKGLRYLSGDFLTNPNAKGPNGSGYPKRDINSLVVNALPRTRGGRSMQFLDDPFKMRKSLLEWYKSSATFREPKNVGVFSDGREIKTHTRSNTILPDDIDANVKISSSSRNSSLPSNSFVPASTCGPSHTPQRLCKTKFNTTAPMYGVSLTSGKPVTIVQKFPDLLQQVIFEICASDTCDVIHGECVQTYMPYLFLVIPLGPVTLTGQDYILVESGCVCKPKYAGSKAPPNPIDAIGLGGGN